ncbi:MAG: Panacea domain-containing protein [Pseudomonadota bacterium]|nr:Panacea domain-containing protein [Pseudomonadota bacterium]
MPTLSYEKFANTVLYLLRSCPGDTGKVKLVKLLYFADFGHYERHASPITGVDYVALPMGPVPDNFEELFGRLERDGFIRRESLPIPGVARPMEAFVPVGSYDEDSFTADELDSLTRVVDAHGRKPGNALVKLSHEEQPWRFVHAGDEARNGKRIPYLLKTWVRDFPNVHELAQAQQYIDAHALA